MSIDALAAKLKVGLLQGATSLYLALRRRGWVVHVTLDLLLICSLVKFYNYLRASLFACQELAGTRRKLRSCRKITTVGMAVLRIRTIFKTLVDLSPEVNPTIRCRTGTNSLRVFRHGSYFYQTFCRDMIFPSLLTKI